MPSKRYKWIENCIISEGKTRIILIDTSRREYFSLPLQVGKFILSLDGQTEKELKSNFLLSEDDKNICLNFLIEKELIFLTDQYFRFPSLDKTWDFPYLITNALIDLDENNLNLDNFLAKSNGIGIYSIQIRKFSSFGFKELLDVIHKFAKVNINSLQIIWPYTKDIDFEILKENLKDSNVEYVLLHSAPMTRNIISPFNSIFLIGSNLVSKLSCGVINLKNFTTNINFVTESHFHNSCLNRKISIDDKGEIKNCPSMSESFGNIKDTSLAEAIEKPGFKKYWDINKDKIHVCKDCEFRYICTDCRAYIEDPNDILSKPLKCGYNPYTGEWSDWSTNPLKQKAIDFYGMREMVNEMKTKSGN